MNRLYWAWGAVLADIGIFFGPLPLATDVVSFATLWLLHAGFCAILASVAYVLLPGRYRRPRWLVWLLMFDFAFIAPVVGPLGMLYITRSTLQRERSTVPCATPQSIELPEYNVHTKEAKRGGQGAIRSRLTADVPAPVRMQSLLTLQVVPNRVANPILENLLGDSEDDVRLVAFGMLDAEEKKLSVLIHRERGNLERPLADEHRRDCLRHLAELHWELIYAALAQGELRRYILGEARAYIDAAFALTTTPDAGILFLRGRILLEQGEVDAAKDAITAAIVMGQPETSALPYLAEMAFRERGFVAVRGYLKHLSELQIAPRTRAIVDLWLHRDSLGKRHDPRILSHI